MQHSSKESQHICIDIYDEVGIGGGASGISGGLLHPYSPKGSHHFFLNLSNLSVIMSSLPLLVSYVIGIQQIFIFKHLLLTGYSVQILAAKLLWRGAECWKESLNLLSIAEAAWHSRDSTSETQEFDQELDGFIVRRGFALSQKLLL